MGVPRVKILPPHKREKRSWIPAKMRREVIDRDQNRCVFCNSDRNIGLAYRVPKCRGGRAFSFNLVLACRKCRRKKGHQLVEEFILSPYFQFEILKVGDPFKDMTMTLKVIKLDGEKIVGEVEKLPDPCSSEVRGFWLRMPGNGRRRLILFEQCRDIIELGGVQKEPKD